MGVWYFVEELPQASGTNVVHKQGCASLAQAQKVRDLGEHLSCHAAVLMARRWYPKANGCPQCSGACHTS